MIKIFLTFFSFSILIITGCTSIKSVERYNKNKIETHSSESLRFTSNNDTINTEDYYDITEEQDSSEIPDEVYSNNIKIDELLKNKSIFESNSEVITEKEIFLMEIVKYINNTPYKFGGTSIDGTDCSSFTQSVYRNAFNINLNRSARDQYKQGMIVNDIDSLKFGDLVFFNTRRRVRPGHVGIYLWDNYFVHASTKYGVTVSSLNEDYYSKRYMGARRIKIEGFQE
ncbi:MAG: C40 family peptidase [Ignavibacterium sp.]|nr:C40 family peptidase [Ignavibacterium sp.]MCX7612420.1 C40 family peptidase [Ignavibacterium sp.]MDW8375214.1 C40 family peptidase [Ignavibacteriales bacterium]